MSNLTGKTAEKLIKLLKEKAPINGLTVKSTKSKKIEDVVNLEDDVEFSIEIEGKKLANIVIHGKAVIDLFQEKANSTCIPNRILTMEDSGIFTTEQVTTEEANETIYFVHKTYCEYKNLDKSIAESKEIATYPYKYSAALNTELSAHYFIDNIEDYLSFCFQGLVSITSVTTPSDVYNLEDLTSNDFRHPSVYDMREISPYCLYEVPKEQIEKLVLRPFRKKIHKLAGISKVGNLENRKKNINSLNSPFLKTILNCFNNFEIKSK